MSPTISTRSWRSSSANPPVAPGTTTTAPGGKDRIAVPTREYGDCLADLADLAARIKTFGPGGYLQFAFRGPQGRSSRLAVEQRRHGAGRRDDSPGHLAHREPPNRGETQDRPQGTVGSPRPAHLEALRTHRKGQLEQRLLVGPAYKITGSSSPAPTAIVPLRRTSPWHPADTSACSVRGPLRRTRQHGAAERCLIWLGHAARWRVASQVWWKSLGTQVPGDDLTRRV